MLQKTINAKTAKQMLPAIFSGLLASLCWIVGDILIVGFTPAPQNYPLLSQTYASQIDVYLATLMLSGSTNRLMWGALIAVFSMPFYLYSLSAISQLVKRKFMMPVFVLMLFGFGYMPLGHAGFFYVGEIYKAILNTDVSAHPQLLETAGGFVKILRIVWMASIGITALAWIVFALFVWQMKTVLKRSAIWLNPIIFVFAIFLLTLILPSLIKDYIGCAVFNVANFIFFAIVLAIMMKSVEKSEDVNPKTEV